MKGCETIGWPSSTQVGFGHAEERRPETAKNMSLATLQ
jgi:hypothetical protein